MCNIEIGYRFLLGDRIWIVTGFENHDGVNWIKLKADQDERSIAPDHLKHRLKNGSAYRVRSLGELEKEYPEDFRNG